MAMNRSLIQSMNRSAMKASTSQTREQLYESKYFIQGFQIIDENDQEIISEILDEKNKDTILNQIKQAHIFFNLPSSIEKQDKNPIKVLIKGNQQIMMEYIDQDETQKQQICKQPKAYLVCLKINSQRTYQLLQDLIIQNYHYIKRINQILKNNDPLTQEKKNELEQITLQCSYQISHMLIEQNEARKEKIDQMKGRLNKFKETSQLITYISLGFFVLFMVLHVFL